MFSHPGIGEALTYSNNGYLLGTDIQPNSTRFSAELNYSFSSRVTLISGYSYSLHGNNIYDANGNLMSNVGGNFLNNLDLYNTDYAYLLDGNREIYDLFNIKLQYEFLYGYYLNFNYIYSRSKISGIDQHDNILWTSFMLNFE
jgi:hypothetical protein